MSWYLGVFWGVFGDLGSGSYSFGVEFDGCYELYGNCKVLVFGGLGFVFGFVLLCRLIRLWVAALFGEFGDS